MVAQVSAKKQKDDCYGYLFFDLVHPSAAAHQLIAEKVQNLLEEQGVQFSE